MAANITELKSTIFLNPVTRPVFRCLSLLCARLIGWKVVGEKPAFKKYIVVAAPHTSNWDFFLFMLAGFILRIDVHWMGKAALFPRPFKGLMVWLGGIPIDRSKNNNVVDQMADYFHSVEQLTVLIPPEGTRAKVDQWKTGFYYIAEKADVPIVLGFVDAATKTTGLGPVFTRSGDVEADMKAMQDFYQTKRALKPRNS
jgi:1-acyl-sn-glycerol-3-phosphate acyltransferase